MFPLFFDLAGAGAGRGAARSVASVGLLTVADKWLCCSTGQEFTAVKKLFRDATDLL
jgi:hypothetical protein